MGLSRPATKSIRTVAGIKFTVSTPITPDDYAPNVTLSHSGEKVGLGTIDKETVLRILSIVGNAIKEADDANRTEG